MERKIGEIFEYNGEWYQCIVGRCRDCYFSEERFLCKQFITKDFCTSGIIFKKLEKVGEPYKKYYTAVTSKTFQKYKLPFRYPKFFGKTNTIIEQDNNITIDIEIKQNKEDIEENKNNFVEEIEALCKRYSMSDGVRSDFISEVKEIIKDKDKKHSLKPFDLEAAKAGKPVCTRDGRKARIVCFDRKHIYEGPDYSIVALINEGSYSETVCSYTKDGLHTPGKIDNNDLMMFPEKKEGWINIYPRINVAHIAEISDGIYPTEAEAKLYAQADCIATVPVEWEE